MLSIDDYMPHGKYAAHGQALLDLRDWSEQTGAELLIILTPGKNVDGKAYDGTKAFLNASNIRAPLKMPFSRTVGLESG